MKNKVVIITGASSGIGKACAWVFAQAGAQVVLAARNLKKLNLVCKELQEAGFTALAVQADVSKEEDCQRLISGSSRSKSENPYLRYKRLHHTKFCR